MVEAGGREQTLLEDSVTKGEQPNRNPIDSQTI